MPTNTPTTRKLAAILFADIVGYTSLMQEGEANALKILHRYETVTGQQVKKHQGEIIKNFGDGSLILFESTVNAIQCAKAMQLDFQKEPKVALRIGIHVGEVVRKNKDVFGHGVNISSRIESMGVPGAVLLSKMAYDKVANQDQFEFKHLGKFEFKNVNEGIEVFALSNKGMVIPKMVEMKGKLKAPKKSFRALTWVVTILLLAVLSTLLYFNFIKDQHKAPTENALAYDYWNQGLKILPSGHGSEEDFSTAIRLFAQAVELDPNFAEGWASLGLAHKEYYWYGYDTRESRLDSSLKFLAKAEALQPEMDEVLRVKSAIHYNRREYDQAMEGYAALLAKNPNNISVLPRLADLQRRQGWIKLSLETREKIARLNPENTENWVEMAWTNIFLKDYKRAFEMRDKALALDPELEWVYFMGALIYWARGQSGDLQKAHEVLEFVPKVESAYPSYFWIKQYWFEQDFEKALSKIQNLSEVAVSMQHAYLPKSLLLGDSFYLLGRQTEAEHAYQEAIIFLESALKESPNDFRFLLALGNAYAGLGQKEKAIGAIQKAADLIPLEKDALIGQDVLLGQMKVYAILAENDHALDIMVKMFSKPSQYNGLTFTAEPFFKNLWNHPRFLDIINRTSTEH